MRTINQQVATTDWCARRTLLNFRLAAPGIHASRGTCTSMYIAQEWREKN